MKNETHETKSKIFFEFNEKKACNDVMRGGLSGGCPFISSKILTYAESIIFLPNNCSMDR